MNPFIVGLTMCTLAANPCPPSADRYVETAVEEDLTLPARCEQAIQGLAAEYVQAHPKTRLLRGTCKPYGKKGVDI